MRKIIITVILLSIIFFVQDGETFRCGTPHFKKDMVLQPILDVPTAPGHPAAPALPIGFQRNFFAIDFSKQQQYTVSATLRASSANCYIFVENAVWQKSVTLQTVQSIITDFDTRTPADPHRGIYDIISEELGEPSDIDENQKVILLLLDIRDIGAFHATAGYFLPIDQQRGVLRHPTFGPLHSNEADILYIDVQSQHGNIDAINAVIAHELQHLVHWHSSPNEEIWIDEGCADYAAFLCGYNINQHLFAFQQTPHISLTDWTQMSQTNLLAHYGASFLFMLYIHEQYGGIQTVAAVINNPLDGMLGLTRTLQDQGVNRTFSQVYASWKVANYLTTWGFLGNVEKPFRYHTLTPIIQPSFTHSTYPAVGNNKKLSNFAAHAIECIAAPSNEAGISINFTTQRNRTADIKVAYLFNTGEVRVDSVPFKTSEGIASVDIPEFGTTIKRMMIIPSLQVENKSFSQVFINYNYNAFEGSLGTFNTHILPNPIHPNYWEIIAIPNETTGIHLLTLTLTYQNSKLLDAQPMLYVENDAKSFYRYVFHLKPEIEIALVRWSIMRGETIIDEGVINKVGNDN